MAGVVDDELWCGGGACEGIAVKGGAWYGA